MAFRSAQQSRIYVGTYSLAAFARSGSVSAPVDMHDVTVLTDTSKQFVVGANTGTFTASGPLDSGGDPIGDFVAVSKTLKAQEVITYLPLGSDGHAWLIHGWDTQMDTTASHSGTADWTLSSQASGGVDTAGVILENNTTVTTDGDGTIHDNGAATSNGAVFHLHTTAFTGFTSNVITVEGSTSGSWSGEETTIATFETQTAATYAFLDGDRQEVTGTIPRYLRVVDNVTGTGSTTRFVAVSRR